MRALVFLLALCIGSCLAQYISKSQFECILPHKVDEADEWVHALNTLFSKYDITTPKRVVAFIAQAIVQTDDINSMVEYTSSPNDTYPFGWNPWCPQYDGGCKYKGRGILQIHGYVNYQIAQNHANILFEKFPDQMAKAPYAFDESGYFWMRNELNECAENGDWITMTDRLTLFQPPHYDTRTKARDRVSACYRPTGSIPDRCGFTYTCVAGDTIQTITTRYLMLPSEIFAVNVLPHDFHTCEPGQQLFIPKC